VYELPGLALAIPMWDDRNAMTVGKGKRASDPNQLAAWSVAVCQTAKPQQSGSKLMGGKGRLKTTTKEQHSQIAAAKVPRKKQSKQPYMWPFP
jgi:hypothetical protein